MNSYKLRRRGALAIAFVSAMLIFVMSFGGINAKAETGTGTVKGTSVNVRSDAGTSAARICTLSNGAALVVTGTKNDAAGNTWYAVSFTKNGSSYTGYIISTYVNYTPAAETSSSNNSESAQNATTGNASQTATATKWKAEVTASNVNVRKKAVSGVAVGKVTTGETVTVRKQTTGSDGKIWYYIFFKVNGTTKKGWIRSDFVKKVETATDSTSPATEDTTGQTTTQDGTTELDLSETLEDSTETTENSAADTSTKKETTAKKKGVLTGDFVRVRKSPVTGNVVCQINKGTRLTIKKEKQGSDGYVWYKVSFKYNGKNKSGFVRSDFVKVEEAAAETPAQTENSDTTQSEPVIIKTGSVTGDYVRVRKTPVNGDTICQLMKGDALVVQGEQTGSDNKVWYNVTFTYNGEQKNGFIRSDFVVVTEETVVSEETPTEEEVTITQDADFEGYMTQQGFPESYKDALRSLHSLHPEWEFRAVQTGLEWNDVIAAESKVGTNLVTKNAITSWKSTEKTAYDFRTNNWYTFDGGAWVAASKEIISYYLDPRNFLTETTIFQFESLEYETYQNKKGVQRLLKGSFMSKKFTEPDGTQKGYPATFVKVGKQVGVSPYHLAARCYQEQGKGTSGSISGTVTGYENIFNYYNVGAYAANGNTPILQGLKYAAASTTNEATNYSRPWNTRYKSLLGGAQYVAQKYVKVGQNTLYFQKFNVVNKKNGLYRHQYMTNIQAAEAEAIKMSKAYTAEDTKLAFYIPIYNNMPEVACVKPISNTNPNNYLATLEIEGQQLTPVFNPETDSYDLTVPKKTKKVKINATPIAATSTVAGTGKVKLVRGENEVKITCTAENGAIRTYTIYIVRQ